MRWLKINKNEQYCTEHALLLLGAEATTCPLRSPKIPGVGQAAELCYLLLFPAPRRSKIARQPALQHPGHLCGQPDVSLLLDSFHRAPGP